MQNIMKYVYVSTDARTYTLVHLQSNSCNQRNRSNWFSHTIPMTASGLLKAEIALP